MINMSASKNKMTERQRQEAQEAKKLKVYTTTFWIVLALCICIVVTTVLSNPVKNVLYKNTTAITVGDHEVNSVQLNYFFIDTVNEYCNQLGNYISLVIDTTKPLNKQIVDEKTGETWADSFMKTAESTLKRTYALYDLATEKGFKLAEDDVKAIDTQVTNMEFYAMYYGYGDVEAYLQGIYGNGADVESYKEYQRINLIADRYYAEYAETLDYTDDEIREYEAGKDGEGEDAKDRFHNFSSVSYAIYNIPYTKWAPEKDDKGNKIEYTADQLKEAREKAKAAAEALAAGKYEDLDAFDAAIKAMEINKDQKTNITCTRYDDTLVTQVSNQDIRQWLIGKDLKAGDMTVIENATGEGDKKEVKGYYVVRFGELDENRFNLKDVRHILIQFEGGKYNSTTGQTTFTDAEKKAALEKAEKIYNEWVKSGATEEAFKDLVEEHSSDTGSVKDGGLYENVYPGQMVEKFEDFCYDENRKAGDHGIVESTYGYHIMFFVGDSDVTYRDFMIKAELRADELEEWLDDLVEKLNYELVSKKHVEMDMILGA
jgi:hypothetical protein